MDDDLFIVDQIGPFQSICISSLSQKLVQESDIDDLGGAGGYFIYELDERPLLGGVHILAKAASFEAALRLAEVWKSQRKTKFRAPRRAAVPA